MKFLIDECLSPELAKLAQEKGHWESSHVTWRGWAGKKDWGLMEIILDGDWTFVTRNAVDFRGPLMEPGSRGLYADVTLHAGLICITASDAAMNLDLQLELFEHALVELEDNPDLVNQVLDFISDETGEVRVFRRKLPPENQDRVTGEASSTSLLH